MKRKIKDIIHNIRSQSRAIPLKISLLYFMISFLWILLSDRIVYDIISDNGVQLIFNTIKGWVYVVVITVILYIVLARTFSRLERAENTLKMNYKELTDAHNELEKVNIELKDRFDQIHTLAYRDPITGLPNRLCLQEKLTDIIRTASAKVALLFIDLDDFKYINDSFGHFFGDAVLAEISRRLTDYVDANAFVARLGGDEFGIIIPQISQADQVISFVQNLLTKLDTSFKEGDINIHLTASIGIAVYPDHAAGFEELLKNADTAMYKAKKLGKNQYVIFNQIMNLELYTKVTMESKLRAAIENKELSLNYQPIYSVEANKICGFEALARWNNPVLGTVAPSVFIPLAEEIGIIPQIGKQVLHSACRFIKNFNKARAEKLFISVNISVHQLTQINFVEEVMSILNANELEPEYLELEITESIWMDDVELKLKKIELLKGMGIKIALDDFGAGYSSLTYLKKLPISILKLDKAFIDDIAISKTDMDIVKGIITLAKTLNLSIIAEGVEGKEQYDLLAEFGCDMIQGYYFSKPISEYIADQNY